MNIQMRICKVYTAGLGKLAIGSGVDVNTETPFISITNLLTRRVSIGEDINGANLEEEPRTVIYFKNLESLAVLEAMVKDVKRTLKHQNKATKNYGNG